MNVETLRKRLAEQLGDFNQNRSDLGQLRAERDQHLLITAELEAREAQLRSRVTELERENTDLAQRLRMRDREFEVRGDELAHLRASLLEGLPPGTDEQTLNGNYDDDIDKLTTALAIERKRAGFLEEQARSLIERLENSDRRSAEASAAIASMRAALASEPDDKPADADSLVAAEARIASAENRLNALLAETGQAAETPAGGAEPSLADELTLETEVESLRLQVNSVESSILADWDSERVDETDLRQRLGGIAASVSRLVYAVDHDTPINDNPEESLFDRVQRFADDGETMGTLEPPNAENNRRGSVSDRLAALREIQGR
jgi:predicted RNase H-like nuclease (RuvC/YqgF family)